MMLVKRSPAFSLWQLLTLSMINESEHPLKEADEKQS